MLKNLNDGSFVKNICYLSRFLNYAGADVECKARNMKLLKIDSDAVQDGVIDFIKTRYSSYITVRIDGLRNINDGNWYYDDGNTPAWSGLKWKTVPDVGESLSIQVGVNGVPGDWIVGVPLTESLPFFCEL